MNVCLCVVQFDRVSRQPDINKRKMFDLINSIAASVDIILLPEGWLGSLIVDSPLYYSLLRELQASLPGNMLLVAGAQYVRFPEETVSTGAFITNKEITFYDKHFPSHAIGEREFIESGGSLPLINYRGCKVASVVCVDLFYPEVVRYLALKGAHIIFNPANIPANRMDLWQHIGITRAAENTVFLAMANNTNTHYPDGREVLGRSFVAGPDGVYFHDFGSQPGVYIAEIDLQKINITRKRWRYLEDISNSGQKFTK